MSKTTATVSLPPDAQARLEMLANQGAKTAYDEDRSDASVSSEND